jgi:glycosyltransferase involved in cell wall biosynthesis
MKISILVPVYNEKKTIMDVLSMLAHLEIDKEILLVDDYSTDGTREMLKDNFGEGNDLVRVFYHPKNRGKGAAVKTVLEHAEGDYCVVQDGDLEYSPQDIIEMAHVAEKTGADAIFGSRFYRTWRATNPAHFVVNKFFTVLTNILYGSSLTDIHTCYKLVRTDLMRSFDMRAERFNFDPELCAKLLKSGKRIMEVPISYRGRSYNEGKKIGWVDGIEALVTLVKYRFFA